MSGVGRATYERLHNGALLSTAAGGGQRLLGRQWHATDSGTASGSVAGGSIVRDVIRQKMEVKDNFIKWHLRIVSAIFCCLTARNLGAPLRDLFLFFFILSSSI